MGDDDLREIGEGSIVPGSGCSGVIGGWTFPFSDTGTNEVAVGVVLTASGRGSS